MAQWSEVSQILLNSRVYPAEKVDTNLIKVQLQTENGRSQSVYVANINAGGFRIKHALWIRSSR